MTRALAVVAVVVAAALLWRWDVEARRADRLDGAAQQLRAQLATTTRAVDSLRRVAGRADTVYRTRYLPRWTTIVESLPPITRRETLLVAAADSAVRSCTFALDACQRLGVARDSVILQQRQLIATLERRPGPCRVPLLGVRCEVAAFAGGVLSGILMRR